MAGKQVLGIGLVVFLGTVCQLWAQTPGHWAVAKADPFWGCDEGRSFVGACSPHGMVKLGPDAFRSKYVTGYRSDLPVIGFSTNHFVSETGQALYGNLLVTPQIGEPDWKHRPSESRKKESAMPGYYGVTLVTKKGEVQAQLTANQNIGRHRYQFEKTNGGTSPFPVSLLLDLVSGFAPHPKAYSHYHVVAGKDGALHGQLTVHDQAADVGYTLHFHGQTNLKNPTLSYRLDTTKTTSTVAGKKKTQIHVDTSGLAFTGLVAPGEEVELTLAISYKNHQESEGALARALSLTFEEIRAKAEQAWEDRLSVFTCTGLNPEQEKRFYSALYHTLLSPTDVSGNHPDDQYGESHFWDMEPGVLAPFVAPLHGLLYAPDQRRFTHALMRVAEGKGQLPNRWLTGSYAKGREGAPAEIILSDAVLKGTLTGLDVTKAWKVCYRNALLASDQPAFYGRPPVYLRHGFCEGDVEHSLAYSYNDHIMSGLAVKLVREYETGRFGKKALKTLVLWDEAKGTFIPRDTLGHAKPLPLPANLLHTPAHLLDTVRSLLGGNERFIARLDSHKVDMSRSADRTFPLAYASYASPEATSRRVKEVMESHFTPGPKGLQSIDASGSLSAWYIWACMGMYPVAGTPDFRLYPPGIAALEVTISGGKRVKISGSGPKPYWNGKPVQRNSLKASDLLAGGSLEWRAK